MIHMPLSQILDKIKENTKLTDDEINSKIKAKLDQLSGLISREGAAHIIANELGVKLFENVSGRLQIKNILTGMRSVEVVGKVQQVFDINEFQRGEGTSKVGSFILGDETGTIRVVLWGAQADNLKRFGPEMVVKVQGGYVRENNGRKEIHLNERGNLMVSPAGEAVGEVKKYSSKRKRISELSENDSDVELLGTIVQVYDIRFYEVCPKCNKRARQREDGFYCDQHKKIIPAYSYVFNLILDDGSDNIRAVFFKKQAERLLEKTQEEMLQYRQFPEKFEEAKHDLLGKMVKAVGRVNKNENFDRIEFVSQLVFPNPSPEEEIASMGEGKKIDIEPVSQEDKEKEMTPEIAAEPAEIKASDDADIAQGLQTRREEIIKSTDLDVDEEVLFENEARPEEIIDESSEDSLE